jgi:hypothetical protein
MTHAAERNPSTATTFVHGVDVIAGDERPLRGTQRSALGAATAAFLVVVFGFGLTDRSTPSAADRLQALVTTRCVDIAPALAPDWIDESPPPLPKRPVPPAMLANWAQSPQLMFLCQINETLLRSLWQPGTGLAHVAGPGAPREYDVFTPPDGGPNPRFRYPPSTTMPDGLTTNSFGFRGPDLAVDKPPRTIRIACVGASTTVDSHHFAWSYPELMQHWLNRWAQATQRHLRFEVINAGREAIRSSDIRAIVQYEVLPLAVDYVLYYEGANQCGLPDMLRHVQVTGEFTPATPPATQANDLRALAAAAGPATDLARRHSANLRRLLSLGGFGANAAEPGKPPQRLALPAGVDPAAPDLTRAWDVLQLGPILADLDGIQLACSKARAKLVLASFCWMVEDGLHLDITEDRSVYSHLNGTFWPLRYEIVEALTDLQNRYFAAWAAARGVPFFDVAAQLPRDPQLYIDAVHGTELGSRLRAWIVCAELVRTIEQDLAAGSVPVPDQQIDRVHPHLQPARHLTAAELDRR